MKFYSETISKLALSPFTLGLKEHLLSTYVPPKIHICNRKLGSNDNTEHHQIGQDGKYTGEAQNDLKQYADIFFNDGNLQKNIYIQGEPGIGKTTFATKLVLDWCKLVSLTQMPLPDNIETTDHLMVISDRYFQDIDTLKQFNFLFWISLRDCYDECGIEEIIQNVVVIELNDSEQYTKEFIEKVLSTEHCLVILDGLDEWIHPKDRSCSRKPQVVPHKRTGGQCTFLSFTRPWKLSVLSMQNVCVDQLFNIYGIVSIHELVKKYVESMNRHSNVNRDYCDFLNETLELDHLLETPILAVSLLCLWFERNKMPESITQIYCSILEMLGHRSLTYECLEENQSDFFPKCFKDKAWCKNNIHLLDCLGSLAFFTLHTDGDKSSEVFSETTVNTYLKTIDLREQSFSAGILTRHQLPSLNRKKYSYSFLHKTFQEFLAAYYVSTRLTKENALFQILFKFYSESRESLLSIDIFFVFVCGLNPCFALEIAEHISSETLSMCKTKWRNYAIDFDLDSHWFAKSRSCEFMNSCINDVQILLLRGYNESVNNDYKNVDIALKHVTYFDYGCLNSQPLDILSSLTTCIGRIKDRIETVMWLTKDVPIANKTIFMDILQHSSACLRNVLLRYDDRRGLCTQCLGMDNLKGVELLYLEGLRDTDQICVCCEGLTAPEDSRIVLQNLFLTQICLIRNMCQIELDITTCINLQSLTIRNSTVVVFVNTKLLKHCDLVWYDLSKGNIATTIIRSDKLEVLSIRLCKRVLDIAQNLSQKNNLHTLCMENADLGDCCRLLPESVQHVRLIKVAMSQSSWSKTMIKLPLQLKDIEINVADLGENYIMLSDSIKQFNLNGVTMTNCSWNKTMTNLPSQIEDIQIRSADLGDCDITPLGSVLYLEFNEVTMTSLSWRHLLEGVLRSSNLKICMISHCLMSTSEHYLTTIHGILNCDKIIAHARDQDHTVNGVFICKLISFG